VSETLLSRLQSATGPSRELDRAIAESLGYQVEVIRVPDDHPIFKPGGGLEFMVKDGQRTAIPPWTESIDAALTLMPEGFYWDVSSNPNGFLAEVWATTVFDGHSKATPAIALLIAIERAQEDRKL